jgi:hypothetical protein
MGVEPQSDRSYAMRRLRLASLHTSQRLARG